MKGFVITLALNHLEKELDPHMKGDLLDNLGGQPGGGYLPMEDYPDSTLVELIEQSAQLCGMTGSKLGKIMGVFLFTELFAMNPDWVEQGNNTFGVLKRHDVSLNATMELSFPGLITPVFNCLEINTDKMEVDYCSPFLPANVAEGLIDAIAIHFNEHFTIDRLEPDPPVGCNKKFILRRKVVVHSLIAFS